MIDGRDCGFKVLLESGAGGRELENWNWCLENLQLLVMINPNV